MKITNTLPQFTSRPTLLIVTGGKEEAHIYFACDGVIEKRDDFRAEVNRSTDTKGSYTATASRGRVMNEGSIIDENWDRKMRRAFLTQLTDVLSQRIEEHAPTDIYVFSPAHIVESVKECIPSAYSKGVRDVYKGNYEHLHPFKLLEKIQDSRAKETAPPQDPEAAKLLRKGNRHQ